MKMTKYFIAIPSLLLSLSLCCDKKADGDGHEGHDHGTAAAKSHEGHKDHDGNESLDGHEGHDHGQTDDSPLKDIQGARAQVVGAPKELSIWVSAEVVADELSQFVLSSPVNGILGGLLVPPGRQVAAGTALAEVKSPELARLYADWLAAKAKLAKATASLAREERLDAKKATSQRDLEEAISEASIAKAEEESARLALESLGIKAEQGGSTWVLRAPKAGVVTDYKVVSGQGISAGQELGNFLASGSVIARMELAQPTIGDWKPGTSFSVRHSDGRKWKGELEGVVPALSSDTMRQTYRLRLSGASLPMPGAPIEVEIPYPSAITVPQAALQTMEGRWGVFALHGEIHFHPVVRGPEVKGEVVILKGVKQGDTIVVEGAYLVKAHLQKLANPDEGGHVH